jgi:hypothetical protein
MLPLLLQVERGYGCAAAVATAADALLMLKLLQLQ